MAPNSRSSFAWEYFTVDCDDSSKAICKLCKKQISRGRTDQAKDFSTSPLLTHLRTQHKDSYAKIMKKKARQKEAQANLLAGVQHHNHLKPKVEINCNGNDDDDDDNDGIRLDDSNIIIPGILAGIGKRLIEEFSGDDRKKSSPKSRETQMKITQACVHCGKMNPTPRRSSLDGGNVTSQEGCHGNLEKLVASAMEKEFKKFRLELLDELKALLEK